MAEKMAHVKVTMHPGQPAIILYPKLACLNNSCGHRKQGVSGDKGAVTPRCKVIRLKVTAAP